MPAKNSLKEYFKDGFYHVYNRGVEKRIIFQDVEDYQVFLNYLKEYLEPPPPAEKMMKEFEVKGTVFRGRPKPLSNFFKQIELIAYGLMPNHFHLLLKQAEERSLEFFMRALATRYTIYFNRKYGRVGHLYQGTYKAVIVDGEGQLLHLSRYIHLNPVGGLNKNPNWRKILENSYSSYNDYLEKKKTPWVKPQVVLSYFNKKDPFNSYRSFVEDYKKGLNLDLPNLTNLTID